jgi:glutamate racemase
MIGFFDSGLGGLSVLKETVKRLPKYDYVYLADTARSPYGNRSQAEIYKFTCQAVDFLFGKGCRLVILACNTASSQALRKVQRRHLPKFWPDRRVLGVIIPAVEASILELKNHNGRVGVMATKTTVGSKVFEKEFKKKNRQIKVFTRACSLLVSLVEKDQHDLPENKVILEKYLKPLLAKKINTLVLGCTHFGYFRKQIFQIIDSNILLVSADATVPIRIEDYLKRHPELGIRPKKKPKRSFYTTDQTDRFKMLGSKLLGQKIESERISF